MWRVFFWYKNTRSSIWTCCSIFPSLLTLLLTSLSLGRMSRLKPSAWPLVLFPPFMKLPKARIRPRTRFTVSLSCSVCRGDRCTHQRYKVRGGRRKHKWRMTQSVDKNTKILNTKFNPTHVREGFHKRQAKCFWCWCFISNSSGVHAKADWEGHWVFLENTHIAFLLEIEVTCVSIISCLCFKWKLYWYSTSCVTSSSSRSFCSNCGLPFCIFVC